MSQTREPGASEGGGPAVDVGTGVGDSWAVRAEAESRRRKLLVRVVRVAFLVLFLTVMFVTYLGLTEADQTGLGNIDREAARNVWATLIPAMVLAVVTVFIDVWTPQKRIAMLVGVFVGLLAAMLATYAISAVIDLLAESYDIAREAGILVSSVKVLVGICLAYLAIATVLQTQDDFRLVIPYVEFAKQVRGQRPLVLDTSALIDGRVVELGRAGLLQSPLVILDVAVQELQVLADSSDRGRRARGRRGLESVGDLRRVAGVDVSIERTVPSEKPVDDQLVEYCRASSSVLVTGDSALARIARIQDVSCVNVHEVAGAMRPRLVVGEKLVVGLSRAGEQAGQAVGYLDDGTMVVVARASGEIGREVWVTVSAVRQTSAGRLVFAELDAEAAGELAGGGVGASGRPMLVGAEAGAADEAAGGEGPGAVAVDDVRGDGGVGDGAVGDGGVGDGGGEGGVGPGGGGGIGSQEGRLRGAMGRPGARAGRNPRR